MHGLGLAYDEGENGYDDERHEGAGVHQLERASSVERLTFHSTGDFLPPSCQVPDATGGNIRRITRPAQPFEVVKTLMHLQGVPDEILCREFLTTLKGPTRVWFSKLAPNTISTFKELSGHFVTHFIGGKRYKKSSTSLLNNKQRKDESLRLYVPCFNKKAILINEVDDKVLVTTFINRLQSGVFIFSTRRK